MKKILIISKEQFGYHTDIYKWCEFLKDSYEIHVITFNSKKKKIQLEGVKVHYVPSFGSRTIRGAFYIFYCISKLIFFHGIIIICYFKEAWILKKIFPSKKMVLDIRTLDISKEKAKREHEDNIIKKTAKLFDYVTVISDGIRQKINLSNNKSSILPLGGDLVLQKPKSFDVLKLLYVGTFNNRDIDKTIKGIAILKKNRPEIEITYDIIGDGYNGELNKYKELVTNLGLDNNIHLHGYIAHHELKVFLDKCNIGVSFIPMTDYFEYQPATKSFEYILSGLFTIATSTYCNKEIITEANGILIQDTPEDFAKGLIKIYEMRNNIKYELIQNSLLRFQWNTIINDIMKPILLKIEKLFNI